MEETTTHDPARSSPHFTFVRLCRAFRCEEAGASLVEYVLLVALIAAVCVGAVTLLGLNVNAKLGAASDMLR